MEEHDEYFIVQLMKLGYTREEAINILNGYNPDGSVVEILPF